MQALIEPQMLAVGKDKVPTLHFWFEDVDYAFP
jgi:hypothetical protein